MLKKKKLIIIDNSFKDFRGHHFHYNLDIIKNFKNKYDIKIYSNLNVNDQIKNIFKSNLIPYFKETSYFDFENPIKKKIKSILRKQHIIKKIYITLLKKEIIFNVLNKFFKRVIIEDSTNIQINNLIKKTNNSNFFFHSLSTDEFIKLCFLIYELKKTNNNKFILLYRRDPREIIDYFPLVKNLINEKKIILLTDSYKIQDLLKKNSIYSSLMKIPIITGLKRKIKKVKKNILVTYLGDARFEKGYFDLPKIVNLNEDKFDIKFNIQSNSNNYDLLKYKQTLNNLKKNENVKLILKEQSKKDYIKMLNSTDVTLLPYESDNYKYRTSGVFYESIYFEKPAIVPKKTWMSSYYKTKNLKKLVINDKKKINEIFLFIKDNYSKILNDVKKLKKQVIKKNNFNEFNKILRIKNHYQDKKKAIGMKISYVVDEDTILRLKDGNRFGSMYILKLLEKKVFPRNHELNANFMSNQNISDKLKSKIISRLIHYFPKIKTKLNFLPTRTFFNLNIDKLTYHNALNPKDILINDIIIINYHYLTSIINELSVLSLKKIFVIVHDLYSSINNDKKYFIDKENISYIFLSFEEFAKVEFSFARKFCLYPLLVNEKKINRSFSGNNYKYIFLSSGADIDILNLRELLNKTDLKIYLIGAICNKLKNDLDKNKRIKKLGFVENLNPLFKDKNNIFLVPRFFGTGIPIKMIECINHNAKVILFGDSKKFGVPGEYILDLITKFRKKIDIENKISKINYRYIYNNIKKHIKIKNQKTLKLIKTHTYENI